MWAGQLKHSITIQSYTESVSGDGDPVKSWSNLATVRAQVSPVRGEEKMLTGNVAKVSVEVLVFTIRADQRIYADDGSDKGTKLRIVHRGVDYDVTSIEPLYQVGGLRLTAERIK